MEVGGVIGKVGCKTSKSIVCFRKNWSECFE